MLPLPSCDVAGRDFVDVLSVVHGCDEIMISIQQFSDLSYVLLLLSAQLHELDPAE
jgi:hypothetical protein